MAETQINDSASEPDPHPGTESSPCHVTETWQQMLQGVLGGVLGIVLLLGALAMVHYYAPLAVQGAPPDDLQKQVHELTAQIEQLKEEQAMPAVVLNRYRNSIGYIYGVYQVGFSNKRPEIRARVSGTGFLVADGLLATNRHVAQPWYGDTDAEKLIGQGAHATLENLVVFFPGEPTPVTLSPASISKTSDLAVLRINDAGSVQHLSIL